MTDARHRGAEPVDGETLAAFIDGRLDAIARARVEAHIAECEDCYEAFVETAKVALEAQLPNTLSPSRSTWSGRRALWSAGGVAAAAALVVAAWLAPTVVRKTRLDSAMNDLVVAVGSNRFLDARLSKNFAWGPRPSAMRGETQSNLPPQVRASVSRVLALTTEVGSPTALHAQAVAKLAIGETDEAITALEQAKVLDSTNVGVRIDLSAALLERQRKQGGPNAATTALNEADAALALSPTSAAALFNRALAVEIAQGREASRTAWQEYLKVDGRSKWAEEARARASK